MYTIIDRLYRTAPFYVFPKVFSSREVGRKAKKKAELKGKWRRNYPEYEIKLVKLVEVR